MTWSIGDVLPVAPPRTGWYAELGINPSGIPSAEAFGHLSAGSFQLVAPHGIPSGEAVGAPHVVYPQTVTPTSIASTEAFGGSALNPGEIGILAQHIASTEAFGTPSVGAGGVLILPTGFGGEQFGTPTLTTGPVVITATGLPSAEAFGSTRVNLRIAPMTGIASEQAFGHPLITLGVSPGGIASLEGFGSPTVIGPPQAIQPAGIASLEAFGGSDLDPGAVFVLPQGIASGAAFGTAAFSPGPVSVAPAGIASAGAFGTAAVAVGSGAIQYIGSNKAAATTVTVPGHQAGDLIVMVTYGNLFGTIPTMPGGWTNVLTAVSASTLAIRVAYKVAASSSETSGTWTNSAATFVHVLRNATAIGASASATGSSTTMTYPALTMQAPGSSWVLGFAAHNASTGNPAVPSGLTERQRITQAGIPTSVSNDTDGAVGSWTSRTSAVSGVASNPWIGASIEIKL